MAMKLSPEFTALLEPASGKAQFATLRILNFACLAPVFVLFVGWLERAAPRLSSWLARLGALSLEMFAWGVVLTMLLSVAFLALGGDLAAYVVVLALGLVGYVLSVAIMVVLS